MPILNEEERDKLKMKKICIMILISMLCFCLLMGTAYASRYCTHCNTITNWKANCSHLFQYNTNYQQHDLSNGSTCNYYDQYFKTFEVCSVCENWVNKYQVNGHLECSLHQIANSGQPERGFRN